MSTTWPCSGPGARKMRSMRLPSAPPSTSPSATAHPVERSRRATRMITTTTATATSVSTQVYPVASENAAPGLRSELQVDQAAEDPDRLPALQLRDRDDLGDDVERRAPTTAISDEQPDLGAVAMARVRHSGDRPGSGP